MSVLPPLEEEFVTSGRLQVRVQPIAILGGESELAAQAAECAGEQGSFWQYSDALFASQAAGEIAISQDNLTRLATFVNVRKVPATVDALRSAILAELAGGS